MNGERRKKYKPRKSPISEEDIKELAGLLTSKYMGYGEIIDFVKGRIHKRYEIDSILGCLETRGFLVTQERRRMPYGYKTFYTIMTKEKYEKIEEEHRENAKRRLLAAVSY